MILKTIDQCEFQLKEEHNFSWLSNYGKVFTVFSEQDSGNIAFGIEDGKNKYFIKYAGCCTKEYKGKVEDAIMRMKASAQIYEDIKHPNLIQLIWHGEIGKGYACIYKWVNGECLHAHWDFEKYPKYTHPQSPNVKFNNLELKHKLNCLDVIFNIHEEVAKQKYVAIDFYDGSIMYDFDTNTTTICDIDFYSKSPVKNEMGRMWGSSRFMSPEEFQLEASIDEVTNVFTMGAVAFELLGNNYNRSIEEWKASEKLFQVAKKATSNDRNQRYQSISDFYNAWKIALETK
ncbi:serine/threonine protein kinase [Clostridium cellulovorans]|uniref:Serine/threonine-protein kinase-like domain n=1 Tax=Clostridium cellulovorans (strain ATCC 35296 / DSM 3052 / OCM 3 / 743B) TaxID=573061 RepID=D9SUI9_CLOC7|nr:serine/threonine protein kinase [Clostridium cellulovorans]ADL52944.1 Serine/threonine-protein kinase-like domain [Clostridium cellulovorans 743B]